LRVESDCYEEEMSDSLPKDTQNNLNKPEDDSQLVQSESLLGKRKW